MSDWDQNTAPHCNTLQNTAKHCKTLQHAETHCNTLRHTATQCNTLQHTATHYNTLQDIVKHWTMPYTGDAWMGPKHSVSCSSRQCVINALYDYDVPLASQPWDMTRWYVWHDSFICVTWLVDMCDMTHWYVWHDSLICATIHRYLWHDDVPLATGDFQTIPDLQTATHCNTSPLYGIFQCVAVCCSVLQYVAVFCSVLQCVTVCRSVIPDLLLPWYDMTHWFVWHDSFMCVTWFINVCDMTHWRVWHDSLICVTWSWVIGISNMTH